MENEIIYIWEHALGVFYPGDLDIELILTASQALILEEQAGGFSLEIEKENSNEVIVLEETTTTGMIEFSADNDIEITITVDGTIIYHPTQTYLPEVKTYLEHENNLAEIYIGPQPLHNLFSYIGHNHNSVYAPMNHTHPGTGMGDLFELVDPGPQEYIRAKRAFTSVGGISAYCTSLESSLWADIPVDGITIDIVNGSLRVIGLDGVSVDILKYFEVINKGQSDEYLRVNVSLASTAGLSAYNTTALPTLWNDIPVDGVTIALVNGSLKVISGLGVSSWNDLTDKPLSFPVNSHSHLAIDLPATLVYSDRDNDLVGNQTITGDLTVTGNITATGSIAAYVSSVLGSFWIDMPHAASNQWGGIQLYGAGDTTHFLRGDGSWQAISTGSGMVYPNSGIALSNGVAWSASILTDRIPIFSSAISGSPSSLTYLRGDGSWSTPASGSQWIGTTSIYYNGNVGIGTSTPSQKLTVNGEIGILGGSSFVHYSPTNGNYFNMTTDETTYYWKYNNSTKMTLSSTGTLGVTGTVTATNHIISSDRRLKQNIAPIDFSPVDIEYKSFELISDAAQKRYGVIAQELQVYYPELVRTDYKGFLSVAYTDLFALELAYIKPKLSAHEIKIKELEGRVAYLEGRVA